MESNNQIAIIGLGYVGLPLAVEFAKKYKTVGYDINQLRIDELNKFNDITLEVDHKELESVIIDLDSKNTSNGLFISSEISSIKDANIFIITVPTPTDKNKNPVLTPLASASESIGKLLKKDDIVIYESTVYLIV